MTLRHHVRHRVGVSAVAIHLPLPNQPCIMVCASRFCDRFANAQVRIENLIDATLHVPEVLSRVKKEYVQKTYGVASWTDHVDFLSQIAFKSGRLLKVHTALRLVGSW